MLVSVLLLSLFAAATAAVVVFVGAVCFALTTLQPFTPQTDHRLPLHDLDISGHLYIYIPDLYDLYDLYNLYDLAHVAGWEGS